MPLTTKNVMCLSRLCRRTQLELEFEFEFEISKSVVIKAVR